MSVSQIRIYFKESPLINSQGNNFTLGYIDETGKLFSLQNDDAGVLIVILEPSDAILLNNNYTVLLRGSQNNSTLRMSVTYQSHTEYFSFLVAPPVPQITQGDIYNNLVNYLPKNLYSQAIDSNNYADNIASSAVILELYKSFSSLDTGIYSFDQIVQNIFPKSGAIGWEYFLTGNNRLLFQESTQYGLLLQHIYSCEINNNSNPYWVAFNISKYIYLWLNKQRFVYISENSFQLLNAFILNLNSLGSSIFTSSNSGSNIVEFYILTDNPDGSPPITTEEQSQINIFIRQILRAGVGLSVDYTKSAADLNLIYIGDTYYKDPRQNNSYCIAYNQNILDEALGYLSNLDQAILSNITDFSITPSDGSILVNGNSYPIVITTTPPWSGVLPVEQYIQIYSNNDTILSTSFDGATLYLNANSVGMVDINLYLGVINYSNFSAYTYTII